MATVPSMGCVRSVVAEECEKAVVAAEVLNNK